MPRIHRVDPNAPGLTRRRRGRGFVYLDRGGIPIADESVRRRIQGLAIPPAWEDVWICPDPWGHLQATGVDAAGRKQYRYHDDWRARRDREKHRRIERFGRALPVLRRGVGRDLARTGLPRERVLAGAIRILDLTALRVGGEQYAKQNGSFGLATLRREHVQVRCDRVALRFNGKSGKAHALLLRDERIARLVRDLADADGDELLAWCDDDGWHDVRAADVNEYLRARIGEEFSAKDFRTWHATVLAASLLAAHGPSGRRRAVTTVIREVAEEIGNTPAVCRAAYVDPRVVDRFLDEGATIAPHGRSQRAVEEAVLTLLAETSS